MPCSNCMTPYSALRKEHGCSKCGFGFCEKCLSQKVVIPGLSPKPVSVCSSCHALLTGKAHIAGPNLHRPEKSQKSKNWWGDGPLPPPSLRNDYAARATTTNADDLKEIEARFAKLKEQRIEPESSQEGNRKRKTPDNVVKPTPTVNEIEERLAALRGVPVDVIRKPRLMFMNDSDEEDPDIDLGDDAKALLEEAEVRYKTQNGLARQPPSQQPPRRPPSTGYVNEALRPDTPPVDVADNLLPGPAANRQSDISLDSVTVNKIVKECQDAPSIASSASNQVAPNFADLARQVQLEAEEAERQAAKFLAENGENVEEIIPPPRSVSLNQATPPTHPASKKAASGGFFSKFFKHSK